MTDEEYQTAFQAGFKKGYEARQDEQWHNALSKANEDPTGQDLDDFLDGGLDEEPWDYCECPIQKAERMFGA